MMHGLEILKMPEGVSSFYHYLEILPTHKIHRVKSMIGLLAPKNAQWGTYAR